SYFQANANKEAGAGDESVGTESDNNFSGQFSFMDSLQAINKLKNLGSMKPEGMDEGMKIKFDEETVGTELKGRHPGLIISDNWYNEEGERVIVMPCSTTLNPIYPFEVFIPNLANNGRDGKIMVDQIKGIDKTRLMGRAVNRLNEKQLEQINEIMLRLFKLKF
ncbi:5859_t:CDS:2, partial [Racocetra persica]